jgi:anti-anti-sigma factor
MAATMTATVEHGETPAQGVRLVRLKGSLTQKGVADVGPAFAAAVRGSAGATASPPADGATGAAALAAGETVVVDLSAVDVIATTGITLLLVSDRELKKAGGRMVLAGTRGLVRDVLLRCRLDKVLTLAPSAEEAIQATRQGA